MSCLEWVGEKGTHPLYEGEVESRVPNGQGILTTASNGNCYVGEYMIGSLWNRTMKEKDGIINYKAVNWKKDKK